MSSDVQAFGVDENGMIITEVSHDKITPRLKTVVDDILTSILQELRAKIDGVYLYGSVVNGRAVEGRSDLDMIIVFRSEPDREALDRVSKLATALSKKYEHIFRDIGLEVTFVDDLCSPKERDGGMCFLKHLCLCIYGRDLTQGVSSFKPSREVARGFNGDIGEKLEFWKSNIRDARSTAELEKVSKSFAKKIVRTGFSLVMPRAGSWTTDLDVACQTFARYYPEHADRMATALNWAKHGSSDKMDVLELAEVFGSWLASEFKIAIDSAG